MGKSGVLLLFVAFAAGGGIGFVAGTGAGDGPPLVDEGGSTPDAPRRPTPSPERELKPLPDGVQRSLTTWIDDYPAPEVETGTGVITGFVRTEDGQPLAGVLVRATRRARWGHGVLRGSGPPEDRDLEKLVRDQLERILEERATRAETMTGADGGFRLTGLVDTMHSLVAYLEGYQLEPRGNAWQARPGGKVDFVGKPVVKVPLTVLDPDGRAPEHGVQIYCSQGNRQDAQYWTSKLGAIALAPGAWKIRAVSQESMHYYGQGAGRKSDELALVLEAGVDPDPVTLQLKDSPGLKGRIVFPAGDVNSYCQVAALKIPAGKDPDPDRLVSEGQQTFVHAQMGGEFFLELPAGSYLIGIVTNHRKVVTSKTVEVGTGVTEVTLEFPEPDPADSLVVRVEGPDGKLVGEASFLGGYASEKYKSGGGSLRSVRQADGTFRVDHYEMERDKEKPDGRYWIEVRTSRYGAQRLEYVRDATRDLSVRFDHPATLEVTLRGYATSDHVGNLQLAVTRKDGGSSGSPGMHYFGGYPGQPALNAEGVQSFGPLAPGTYTITVNLKRQRWQLTPVATHEVVLKSGTNTHSIPMPVVYTLTVTVDEAKEGASIYLSKSSKNRTGPRMHFPSHRQKVKDGRAVFENLPAGEYRLSGSGGGLKGRMTVTLPGTTTVRFAPE